MTVNRTAEAADLARLYRALARQLERIVGKGVPTPEVVDDACQFAWTQLVVHGDRVHAETALAWLTTTAVREAFRLSRVADREPSLEALVEVLGEAAVLGVSAPVEEPFEARDRLLALGGLPTRQQRMLWLRAMGLTYAEVAVQEGATTRTVERQLLRARTAIAATSAQ